MSGVSASAVLVDTGGRRWAAPSVGQAEALKWLGLATMFVDHAGRYLGLTWSGWHVLGRAAFPAFAVALGIQGVCSRSPLRSGFRLIFFGLLSSPLFWLVGREVRFDVLVGLGLALCVLGCRSRGRAVFGAALAGALALAWLSDYGPAAVLLPVGVALGGSDLGVALVVVGLGVLLVCGGGAGGVVWFVMLLFGVRVFPSVPRVRRLFLRAYVLQWPVILLLRGAGV